MTGASTFPTIDFNTASSNTVTGSLITNSGYAVRFQSSSNNNTIALSSMNSTAVGFSAVYVTGSGQNTLSRSYISNPSDTGLLLNTANFNTIDMSTIVSVAAGRFGVSITASSSNTISASNIQGSTAVYIAASTGTIINSSILVATNTFGDAVHVTSGNVNVTLTSTTLSAPGNGRGVFLNEGNRGTLSLSSVAVSGASYGLFITTQATGASLTISSMTFRNLATGATAIHFTGGTFVSTFTTVNFEDSSIGANVNAAALDPASRIRMRVAAGVRAGPTYENDPSNVVDWGAPAGCVTGYNVKQSGGEDYTTIQEAVNALPTTLTGPACIVIKDGATYTEQVRVANFTSNGSTLTILADPASGLRPVISPPAASTAAFHITNTSVNVIGLDIVPTFAMTYGIVASSNYVTISSVNIKDKTNKINYTGISLSN
jgi:hypothetical protein